MQGSPSNEWQWAQGRRKMVPHNLVRVYVYTCAFAHACVFTEK